MEYITIFLNDCPCFGIAFVNDAFYFFINFGCHTLAIASGMCKISSDKHFVIIIVIINQSDISENPYFVTIALASSVACLISCEAPVVISSKSTLLPHVHLRKQLSAAAFFPWYQTFHHAPAMASYSLLLHHRLG